MAAWRRYRVRVFLAAGSAQVVNLARYFTPRLVMLDINMPRLNALPAFTAIRRCPSMRKSRSSC
jgi:DNA-binding response OmpR family regulator